MLQGEMLQGEMSQGEMSFPPFISITYLHQKQKMKDSMCDVIQWMLKSKMHS